MSPVFGVHAFIHNFKCAPIINLQVVLLTVIMHICQSWGKCLHSVPLIIFLVFFPCKYTQYTDMSSTGKQSTRKTSNRTV